MRFTLYICLIVFFTSCSSSVLRKSNLGQYEGKDIVIIDIDHTIADVDAFSFLFLDHTEIKPFKGSVEFLNEVSKRYPVVYLTARHEVFAQHTYQWLEHNGFPEGDVLFWNFLDHPLSIEAYKKGRINELQKKEARFVFAVGDKVSDLNAYAAFNINTFILGNDIFHQESSQGVHFVSSWEEIRQKFMNLTLEN